MSTVKTVFCTNVCKLRFLTGGKADVLAGTFVANVEKAWQTHLRRGMFHGFLMASTFIEKPLGPGLSDRFLMAL